MSRISNAMHRLSAWLGAATALMVVGVLWLVMPPPSFMTVQSIEIKGHTVEASRTIYAESIIADWLVTVVPFDLDNPACKTIQGPNLHEGWSIYEAAPIKHSAMHIDVWVGHDGCADRLVIGDEYKMYVTWTPRDGSPPVTHYTTFVWYG